MFTLVMAAEDSFALECVSVITIKSFPVSKSATVPNFFALRTGQLHVKPLAFQVAPLSGATHGLS